MKLLLFLVLGLTRNMTNLLKELKGQEQHALLDDVRLYHRINECFYYLQKEENYPYVELSFGAFTC